MINNILFVVIALFLVTEVAFLIGFKKMMAAVKKAQADYEYFTRLEQINTDNIKQLINTCDKIRDIFEDDYKICELYGEQYDTIKSQYDIMSDQYKTIIDICRNIHEDFENSTEQFRQSVNALTDFKKVLEPWCVDSDQLGERYLKHTVSHPISIEQQESKLTWASTSKPIVRLNNVHIVDENDSDKSTKDCKKCMYYDPVLEYCENYMCKNYSEYDEYDKDD